jgi:hypothetical protein
MMMTAITAIFSQRGKRPVSSGVAAAVALAREARSGRGSGALAVSAVPVMVVRM